MGMIGHEEALERVLARVVTNEPVRCALESARGLALAEDVRAMEDMPAFNRAMMDGFAVRLADAGRTTPVRGAIRAGDTAPYKVEDGHCLAIMTGAPCPEGCQAVVAIEETTTDEGMVRLPALIKAGQNIAPTGSECARGAVVARCGAEVTPYLIAALATLGQRDVAVRRRPTISFILTGDELADAQADSPPLPGIIRDSNGPLLRALAAEMGLEVVSTTRATDDLNALIARLEAQQSSDIIVLSGGVSMGAFDLVPSALAVWGAEQVFHSVAQKPGKPLLFAVKGPQLVFGLPGTPLGTAFSFHRVVAPAARARAGLPARRSSAQGRLDSAVSIRGERRHFMPATVRCGLDGFVLTPCQGRGSSDVFAPAPANVWFDAGYGTKRLEAGETVRFEWMKWQ